MTGVTLLILTAAIAIAAFVIGQINRKRDRVGALQRAHEQRQLQSLIEQELKRDAKSRAMDARGLMSGSSEDAR